MQSGGIMSGPKVLVIDIETSPNRVYAFGLFKQNIGINQIEEPGRILCFAAKWLGTETITFKSEFHDSREDMIESLWQLLDAADAVIGYNSASFDVKWINAELVTEGYQPPSPFKNIDLLRTVRKEFRFPSNKLDFVCQKLDLGSKVKHYGFELWRDVMAGCPKAWRIMKRYNRKDVVLTEQLYEQLKGWITPTLNFGLFVNDPQGLTCPNCGSHDLDTEDNDYITKTARYEQYRCNDCGHVSRSRKKRDIDTDHVLV